jgi:hypothetical protein
MQIAFADSSESGISKSPLSVYSGGISAGAVKSFTDDLNDVSSAFLKVSFLNLVYLNENINLFFDFDWFIPGNNFGSDFGVNFLFSTSKFIPLMGIGAGAHYFHREKGGFGDNIGLSGKIHIGFLLDVTETVAVSCRIPCHITGNANIDGCIGFEAGLIFSSRYKKVKKLNYN